MRQAQELHHGFRDAATGFIARTGTLGDPERLPELLLGQPALEPDIPTFDSFPSFLASHGFPFRDEW
jgi:hypothetical protein